MASEAKAMKMGRAEADMGFMAGIRLKRLARFAAAIKQKSLRGKASLNLSPWSRVLPQEPLPLFPPTKYCWLQARLCVRFFREDFYHQEIWRKEFCARTSVSAEFLDGLRNERIYFPAAALTISEKPWASRLAPPTRAPSMSGWLRRMAALAGFTLPPY